LIRKGAKLVDVRSEAEYAAGHLEGVVNIPLDRLTTDIGRFAPDREQALLLHCASGGRSGVGTGLLKRMGYRDVHNLGSYGRAQKVLAAARASGK
jgi:phage shock protein E